MSRTLRDAVNGDDYEARACADKDPNIFWPTRTHGIAYEEDIEYRRAVAAASVICGGCVIKDACKALGLEDLDEVGVMGGMSQEERKLSQGVPVSRPSRRALAD